MAKRLDEKMLNGFAKELRSYMPGIRDGIENFRADTTQRNALKQAMKSLRMIKSAMDMIGFSGLSQVASHIEETIHETLAETTPTDAALGAWWSYTVKQLEHNLDGLLSGKIAEETFAADVERAFAQSKGKSATGAEDGVAAAPSQQPESQETENQESAAPETEVPCPTPTVPEVLAQISDRDALDASEALFVPFEQHDTEDSTDSEAVTSMPDGLTPEPQEEAPLTAAASSAPIVSDTPPAATAA